MSKDGFRWKHVPPTYMPRRINKCSPATRWGLLSNPTTQEELVEKVSTSTDEEKNSLPYQKFTRSIFADLGSEE